MIQGFHVACHSHTLMLIHIHTMVSGMIHGQGGISCRFAGRFPIHRRILSGHFHAFVVLMLRLNYTSQRYEPKEEKYSCHNVGMGMAST